MREQTGAVESDPERAALELFSEAMAYTCAAALRAAAKIGVADHMSEEARPLADLAGEIGCDLIDLRRVLRLLAVRRIVAESGADCFRLTGLGAALRCDAPHSARAGVLMLTDDMFWTTSHAVSETIRASSPSFAAVFGSTTGEYFTANPEKEALFYQGMEEISEAENRLVARACPLPDSGTVADIGGRFGSLLREVLVHNPSLAGVLFDKPDEVNNHRLGEAGLSPRVHIVGGDFFESVPPADAFLLKRIVHNCTDDAAVQLLDNCRRSMRTGGRVLVIDAIVPPGGEPHDSKCMDFMMLAAVTGGERTVAQLEPLLKRAGLQLDRLISTPTPMSIVVATEA